MSKVAYKLNCQRCPLLRGLRDTADLPCPTDAKGRLITPARVNRSMPAAWRCPVRWAEDA